MTVREHASQHDHVDSLPLISKAATVTEVAVMDRSRREEIRRAVEELAASHGFGGTVPRRGPLDWDAVFSAATPLASTSRSDTAVGPGPTRSRARRTAPRPNSASVASPTVGSRRASVRTARPATG